MTPEELRWAAALETAAAVRERRVTARAVVEAALDRISQLNPLLNAFDVVRTREALAEADALDAQLAEGSGHDGPLAGVPVGIKAEQSVAGLVTTYGGRGNSTPAPADAEVVRRLRDAGAIVIGTTNMPEFGQFPFTEGAAWGVTRNPWDLARSPGGSSGGSAAAVAAGMVPVAIGGDGGGSIRVPAACCGLVGLKPVRGRVSTAPKTDLWGALGTIGPLTRTVADTAAVYDVTSGSLPSDRYAAPPPAQPFTAAAAGERAPLRIGWIVRAAAQQGVRVDRQVAMAVAGAAELLAGAGHTVEQLPGRWPDASPAFVPQFYAAVRDCTRLVEHPERLEWRTRSTARTGVWARGPVLAAALRAGERLREGVEDRWSGCDVVLSPTIACRTPRLGRLDATGSMHALQRSLPMVAFTALANVTGHPAVSVPAGVDRDGLPIGVQLMSIRHDEGVLLSLAAQLERLHPWARPELPTAPEESGRV